MTIFGIGPRLILAGVVTAAVGLFLLAAFHVPQAIPLPRNLTFGLGAVMILVGGALWLLSILAIRKGFSEGRLLTAGVYAWVRHPLYSAIIGFFVPGLALLLNSWVGLVAAVAMYGLFLKWIQVEEDSLQARFGQALHGLPEADSRPDSVAVSPWQQC